MFSRVFFNSSFFILAILAALLLVSNLQFVLKMPLSIFGIFFSVAIALVLLFYMVLNFKEYIFTLLFSFLVIGASYLLATHFYDISFDGQGYHQETIYLIKNGWNPIYEKSGAFRTWIDHYQKGNEIIQANIYLLTNQLEAGKLTNALFILVALAVVYRFLNHLKMNVILRWLISFLVVLNPVVFTQIFTYYLDGNWYLTLVITLASLLSFFVSKKPIDLVVFVISGFIFCTLKFSSIPVFAIFSLFALVYNHQHLKTPLTKAFVGIAILVSICSVHPFLSNITNGYAPFYPFIGKGKTDIINQNIPKIFIGKNRIERLAISLFSAPSNALDGVLSETIEWPFEAIKKPLYMQYVNYEARLGGFGFLFSGILVFSFFLIFIYLFYIRNSIKLKVEIIFIIVAIFVSILINPACWWARMSPQIWLVPIVFVVFALLSKKIINVAFSVFILFLYLINILISGYLFLANTCQDNRTINQFVTSVGNRTIVLDMSNPHVFQQYYHKFKERGIKYKIEKLKGKGELAPFTKDVYFEIK